MRTIMLYLSNAFSIQMLNGDSDLGFEIITKEEVAEMLTSTFVSAIGHADTANVVSNIIGISIPMNRISLSLHLGDTLIVAQVKGGRLPEGATTLPQGVTIEFWKVTFRA